MRTLLINELGIVLNKLVSVAHIDGTPIDALEAHREKGQILTGLLHVNENLQDTHDIIETTDKPLNTRTKEDLCPAKSNPAENL